MCRGAREHETGGPEQTRSKCAQGIERVMLAKVRGRTLPPRVWRGTGVFSARITDFVKKRRRSRRDPSADRILPESDQVWVKSGFHGFHGSWFTRFDHAGCESQGSLLGSKLRSEQFRAVAFGRHFKRRSDREGVPDSDRDLRPCVIVARAARRRDRRTLSLEPLDATHGPPVASRETVVSRDLTLTETHQDKDGTQPWESRA